MKDISIHFRNHLFFYILAPLIVIIGISSYYRFMVKHDYIVEYEGVCDQATEKCFTGCEDDECTQEYHYSIVRKYMSDLYEQCGKDITDCEAASICFPEDRKCSITYCDAGVESSTCSTPIEEPNTQSDNQVEPTEVKLLQNNDINNTNI